LQDIKKIMEINMGKEYFMMSSFELQIALLKTDYNYLLFGIFLNKVSIFLTVNNFNKINISV